MAMTRIAKQICYRAGLLRAYHRLRNRRTLTAVMFHRVLPVGDPRWASADPLWTVSASLFRECLEFFAAEYHPVGLDDVLRAHRGGAALPDRALLITFDDGWADNEDCALPLLRAAGLPAAVFVVADAVGRRYLWQEALRSTSRSGTLAVAAEPLINTLYDYEPHARAALLEELIPARNQEGTPDMLSAAQLRHLHEAGVAIGSHGLAHVPMSRVKDPLEECRLSRDRLAQALAGMPGNVPVAFSFPHGIYGDAALEAARQAGYELLFTSDTVLNHTDVPNGGGVLGRIDIAAHEICGADGRLRAERLSCWLFLRPRRILGGQ